MEYYTTKGKDYPDEIADASDLEKVRADKRKRLKMQIMKGKIHIYLPNQWTLEYEIAYIQ